MSPKKHLSSLGVPTMPCSMGYLSDKMPRNFSARSPREKRRLDGLNGSKMFTGKECFTNKKYVLPRNFEFMFYTCDFKTDSVTIHGTFLGSSSAV